MKNQTSRRPSRLFLSALALAGLGLSTRPAPAQLAAVTVAQTPVFGPATVGYSVAFGQVLLTEDQPAPCVSVESTLTPEQICKCNGGTWVYLSAWDPSGTSLVASSAVKPPSSGRCGAGTGTLNVVEAAQQKRVTLVASTAPWSPGKTVTAGSMVSTAFVVNPPGVASLTCSPTEVVYGSAATAKVALTGVTSSSKVVTLSTSHSTLAVIPTSVTVPAGSSAATFDVKAGKATVDTMVSVKAADPFSSNACSIKIRSGSTIKVP